MECPHCRAEIPDGKRFCIGCGAPVPMACPACGGMNPPSAKFCGECGRRLASDGSKESRPATAAPASAAERRQLTVMFCDLVGSTALASRLDPEDLREVIGAYQRTVAETVARFDGFVAKYMGDGVLVYFGYPKAHEDDAERAVMAGLALIEAIAGLEAPERCHIRIGIGTGLVVVGDLVGSGEAQERGVIGETPNLAARLQALADPGSMVIGPHTRRLVGDLFEYHELGAVSVKGFAAPVQAYRVLRPSGIESRFEALHAMALTPLIGREEEMELLSRRWRRAKDGEGQVVLLSGEPGIGKSRITAALQKQLGGELHTRLGYFCSPYHMDSALYPVIVQFERAAGFQREDDGEARRGKLEALLAPTLSSEATALIADLLSLPRTDRDPQLDLSPQGKKEKTLQALLGQLELLTRQVPVLMVFEDLHWVDPTSRELLDVLVDRIRHLPALLILTFRPEFQPPWVGQAHVTMLALNRLGRREGEALVEQVLGKQDLPDDLVAEIVERTDGIPLFVEELTKAVLEVRASQDSRSGTLAQAPLPALAVPATLHASLMARLDRLSPVAKEVAQIGASIDREFSYELLSAVGQLPDTELQSALSQLVEAGLVFCRGKPPQASCMFKHALVQDASYGTLLRGRRQQLHGRIAAVLEERFPTIVDQQPELLAHHCTQAGQAEKAIAYWVTAGRQSLARSATIESVAQVRKGLTLLQQLPDDASRWQMELDLQSVLGAALLASKGNAALETGQAYSRARELCEQLRDHAALIPILSGLSTYHQTRCEFVDMRQISEALLRVGQQQDNATSRLVGNRSMGLCLYHLGEFIPARKHFERVLDLYTPETHHQLASVAAFDMRTAALSYLALDVFILGFPERALSCHEDAMLWAHELHHAHNLAFALNYAAVFNLVRGTEQAAEALLEELASLSVEHHFPVWLATANIMRGFVHASRGAAVDGVALARKGILDRAATGSIWHGTYYLSLLARSVGIAGETDESHALLSEALGVADASGERWYESELHRLLGELHVARGVQGHAEAEVCFRRALALARGQQAKMWELRAALSLAKLWLGQGKSAESRDLLEPADGWLFGGLEVPERHALRALRNQLQ